MAGQTFQLRGQVIDQTTRQGIPDLRVEAWDRDTKNSDLLGQALTDAQGRFTLSFTDTIFSDDGTDALPDVYVKIFAGKNPLHNTEAQPIKDWTPQQAPLVIEVNLLPAPEGEPYVVVGQVLQGDGPPVARVAVRAWHKNLRSEKAIGEPAVSDDLGRYSIRYTPPDGVKQVDLVVRAIDPDPDTHTVLAESDLICRAKKMETVDLVVGGVEYRGYSEYERVSQAVQPHLDGAALNELTVADIELLERKTRQNPIYIAYLAIAHQYTWTEVPEAAFYGFFRTGLPTALPALVS